MSESTYSRRRAAVLKALADGPKDGRELAVAIGYHPTRHNWIVALLIRMRKDGDIYWSDYLAKWHVGPVLNAIASGHSRV